jgi:AraC-like DNA-binding protein
VSLIFQVAPSSPALRPFVQVLWHFTGDLPHARERILPTGTMQLLVNLHEDELRTYGGPGFDRVLRIRGAAICGAYARPFGIDTDEQRHIVGVSFRPGGAAPFLGPPCDALCEDHVELERLWGREGALLRERLLEAPTPAAALRVLEGVLLGQIARPLEIDKPVDFALGALERGAPVGQVTSRLGMTPKRFIRHFREIVGMAPKRYARVRRFARVLEAWECGERIDWSAVAVACGYFDQAHLIHEFQEFSGVNPTHYRPRAQGDRNHALIGD